MSTTRNDGRIDWIPWLEGAIRKKPSEKEFRRALIAAANWDFCACGQYVPARLKFAKKRLASPKDIWLENMGRRFEVEISERNWRSALDVCHRIIARARELEGGA